jgi:hypothetical protein
MKSGTRYIVLGVVVLAVIAILLVFLPDAKVDSALIKLKIATGYTLLTLIFLYGFAVLIYIANGDIDLSDLLSEGDTSKASMSRFQLLIFTLVIAFSLFLVTVGNMKFPDSIPPEILTLLGISASTYAVSKGIQMSGNQPPQQPPPPPPPGGPNVVPPNPPPAPNPNG